jgi:hypothetical protein
MQPQCRRHEKPEPHSNVLRLRLVAPWPQPLPPQPPVPRSRQPLFNERLAMKTERLADHHQAREALMLSVASVTAIMLTAYLLLLILY